MAKFSTPGQRRKRNIKIILAALVVGISSIAWFIEGPSQRMAKAALKDPGSIHFKANINNLISEEETYRNLKGKRRTRTNYYADFSYVFNNENIVDTREITSSQYDQWEDGTQVDMMAIGPKHNLIRLKSRIISDANTSSLGRSIQAAIVSGIGAIGLSFFLLPILGREPDGYMPEGFYTEESWLDVDDNQLIAITDTELNRLKFDVSLTGKVQKAYQNNTPLAELLTIKGKGVKLDAIPLNKILSVSSSHYEDTYDVLYKIDNSGEKEAKTQSLNLEFLNPTVKTHAMKALIQRIEPFRQLEESVTHYSRLKSAMPGIIGFLISASGLWYFEHWIIMVLLSLLCVFSLKSLMARLWSPTVFTEYSSQESTPEPAQKAA